MYIRAFHSLLYLNTSHILILVIKEFKKTSSSDSENAKQILKLCLQPTVVRNSIVFQHPELELMMKTYITVIAFIFVNTTILHHPISEAYLSGRIPVLCLKESTDQAL